MRINIRKYERPSSIEEVLKLLYKYRGKARIIAGGVTLYELIERKLIPDIEVLIDIERIGLNYVREDGGRVKIGAGCTISELLNYDVFKSSQLMALYEAFRSVKPLQVRNVATIGGEICSGISFFDVPIALCALDAELKIRSINGERFLKIEDFFKGMFMVDIRDDEILEEISLSLHDDKTVSSFIKVGRTAYDYGVVSVAVKLTLNGDKRCKNARIFFGNIDSVPYRAREAEKILEGKLIDNELIERAVNEVPKIEPIPTVHASPEYKSSLMKVLLRDCIVKALERVEV